ncbi:MULTISPECIES: UDP-N-acetylglucosamine 2-epimerase [Streptomyces]|uniref:UDP-N-acetylglucosamine 2-epimerase n=1 Tax=Streptomyces TaxID=1883 RepID=UPI00068EC841|nr:MULTISPECIES: UDP-N-acetylglucosamine 2-epimerase [Streptomyces]
MYWAGSRHAFEHNRPAQPGDPAAFRWHLVIPCRDEDSVVTQTLDGLRAAAPEAHLWVIDDDSADATRELVLAAAAHDPRVHLVQRRRPHARIGKGAALNAAYREISAWLPESTDRSRVVIGVVDADGRLDPGTLAQVCNDKALGRPDTGAVQIGVRMRNADEELPLPGRGRAANARDIPLVHVEAGLRSFDRAMPEEHNRVMVDHVSDLLCAATPDNVANLRAESLAEERIELTGNTVVEVVRRQLPDQAARAALLAAHGLRPDAYVLATVHRPENTDTAEALGAVLAESGAAAAVPLAA